VSAWRASRVGVAMPLVGWLLWKPGCGWLAALTTGAGRTMS
jgi:hypothetical protein